MPYPELVVRGHQVLVAQSVYSTFLMLTLELGHPNQHRDYAHVETTFYGCSSPNKFQRELSKEAFPSTLPSFIMKRQMAF